MKQHIQKANSEQRRVERALLGLSIVAFLVASFAVALSVGLRVYLGMPLWGWLNNYPLSIGALAMALLGVFTTWKLLTIRRTGTGWQGW